MARHTPPLNARDTTLSDLGSLELVHGHMPKWLLGADPHTITALDASMAHSRFYHGLVGKKFGELQSVEAYCGALLAVAVMGEFGSSLNIHNDYLAVVHVHLITDDTLLSTVRHYLVRDEPKTLLWAALQNFSAGETHEDGFNPQSQIRLGGQADHVSPFRPHHFAALCRPAGSGLRGLLRRGRLHLRVAVALLRFQLLGVPAPRRVDGGYVWLPAGVPGVAFAR